MTKKEKDMFDFCQDFASHYLIHDDEYKALDNDVQIVVLSMCAACVAMIMRHLGVQPVRKKIKTSKNDKKSADA